MQEASTENNVHWILKDMQKFARLRRKNGAGAGTGIPVIPYTEVGEDWYRDQEKWAEQALDHDVRGR